MPTMTAMSEAEYRENEFFRIFKSEPLPPFEEEGELVAGWGRRWGCTTDVGRLRVVLMHRPGDELAVVDRRKQMPEIGGFGDPATGWYWIGKTPPDLALMQRQHDALVRALEAEGVEVVLLNRAAPGRMKQIFTRDSCIGVKGGAIITRMARRVRRGEERPVLEALARIGCPVLHTVHGAGIFEGGGFAMLNDRTAVCSVSIACNEEGVRQIETVLAMLGVELLEVHVPGRRASASNSDAGLAVPRPPLRAHFGTGVEVHLHGRVRCHDGGDVPALHDSLAGTDGPALQGHQDLADGGDRTHRAHG